jgi:soluble lytic murein transglycosylase-like protein
MSLRLLALLALTGISCFAAASSAAHGQKAAALPVARIPALPERSESTAGRCPIPAEFRRAFVSASRDSGLQLSMLVAVAQVESEFKADAVSPADARGLMQIVPTTAAELKLDIDRPSTNVLAGARYLRQMLDRFSRTDLALAAYNAGPTVVERLGRAPNSESLSYVANVQQRWAALAGCS